MTTETSAHDDQPGATSSEGATGTLVFDGLLAGLAGVAAVTLAEKLEQTVTGRPNSHVPVKRRSGCSGFPISRTRSAPA